MLLRTISQIFSALAITLSLSVPAWGLSSQTYVASYGVNTANACTRTAPCLTIQFAHDQTLTGGTVSVIDTGNYGSIIITKAITIRAKGVEAKLTYVAGTRPVTINAGVNDRVVIEGFDIDGSGVTSILITSGLSVSIIDCTMSNGVYGVYMDSTTFGGRTLILRSIIMNNQAGVYVTGTGHVMSIVDSLLDNNSPAQGAIVANGAILGMARSIINASPTSIQTSGGSQAISVGPSNIISGAGGFTSTVLFN